MIRNYANAKTRKVHETGKPKGFTGLDGEKAVRRLDILAAINDLGDIPRLASYNLHALKGDRKDQWAMTVNGPWRVVFTDGGEGGFTNVEIIDYHKG